MALRRMITLKASEVASAAAIQGAIDALGEGGGRVVLPAMELELDRANAAFAASSSAPMSPWWDRDATPCSAKRPGASIRCLAITTTAWQMCR
jgi:FAD/FMN-containing dehydrogenase